MPLPLDDRLRPEFIEALSDALLASWDGKHAMVRLHDHRVEGSSPMVTIEVFNASATFLIQVNGSCFDGGPDKTTAELSAEAKAVLLLAAAKAVRKLKGKR